MALNFCFLYEGISRRTLRMSAAEMKRVRFLRLNIIQILEVGGCFVS